MLVYKSQTVCLDALSTMPLSFSGPLLQLVAAIPTEEDARQYLLTKGVLRQSFTCSCSGNMLHSPCPASKSDDLYIFKCTTRGCYKTKSVRSGSVLAGSRISFQCFLFLLYLLRYVLLTLLALNLTTFQLQNYVIVSHNHSQLTVPFLQQPEPDEYRHCWQPRYLPEHRERMERASYGMCGYLASTESSTDRWTGLHH